MRLAQLAAVLFAVAALSNAAAQPAPSRPKIVAAENFYGQVAAEIAGPDAEVVSILKNPDQDPHAFEATPSVARALAAARLVIQNGADYDPWMGKLIRGTRAPERRVIVVATLLGRSSGGNPHLWYDPETMPAVAKAVAEALSAADPGRADDYARRLTAFLEAQEPLQKRITAIRARFAGAPVTATEPVFVLMAAALGLSMRNERFQLAIMNGTEPRASDIAAFEADLKNRRVRALIHNNQAAGPLGQRMLRLARQAGVPIVGVSETQPQGTTYVSWMLAQLDALGAALAAP